MGPVLEATRKTARRAAWLALLLGALLLAGACSEEGGASGGDRAHHPESARERTSGLERTAPPATTPGLEITGESTSPGVPRDGSRVVLRLEGEEGTRFSGLCDVGGQQSVLSGEVPRRYTFDLDGLPLSCRIQKRGGGQGTLRVVLLANGTTRSVQQTNAPEGTIRISYQGGA
ncbi:hypothetical protein Rxyl_2950 [Rubrobacter xylanophilus DSM 9941]|uniref:Uncharacterized protein n=1 Tax=Rubrobacter xylanophilus (strain DSM 9941 / JCM 11954 / NBRC 16129 / PRD-1) TaxID=266117 RepID=Q1ARW8_RUBXD|nr:hypothetical protein Rxyl_2950 [Rubrobacter xylanophilus DSM 9941]